MGIRDIPVVATGRGSQPTETDGAELDYIALPKDMNTYRAPAIPEPEAVKHLDGAHPLLGDCLRVTVGTSDENTVFLDALRGALEEC